MTDILRKIHSILANEDPQKIIYSSPQKSEKEVKSIIARLTKSGWSVEIRYNKHNNIINIGHNEFIADFFPKRFEHFKQCLIKTNSNEYQVLTNKKLSSKLITHKLKEELPTHHQRKKNYLIPDSQYCDFLVELGVMSCDGKVHPSQYKKFKQINRFLEMVHDQFKDKIQDEINIIDFGCGKAYLTFALYHYFTRILKMKAHITGIDLKQSVIDECNQIAQKLQFLDLQFELGMVQNYQTQKQYDFVVTLHACDTATDDAILFALKHQAKQMFFVPCCQHELNKQLNNSDAKPLLKHGIFKDRLTALVTDSMRSILLETCGYKVQALEFIDSEHTAKNILLRCEHINRSEKETEKKKLEYALFKKQWNINPYLENKLIEFGFL